MLRDMGAFAKRAVPLQLPRVFLYAQGLTGTELRLTSDTPSSRMSTMRHADDTILTEAASTTTTLYPLAVRTSRTTDRSRSRTIAFTGPDAGAGILKFPGEARESALAPIVAQTKTEQNLPSPGECPELRRSLRHSLPPA